MPVDGSQNTYPAWLETNERLRDGTEVHLRPLRAEDEPLLEDLAAHMTPADLRLRFFASMRGLSHALAWKLSHIDYDRAMALVALKDGAALGVARFHAEPDRSRAEYAIAVRSDWKGRGLGYLLMTRLHRGRTRMGHRRTGWPGLARESAHARDVPRIGLLDRHGARRSQCHARAQDPRTGTAAVVSVRA
jgi:acetyltransferase